MLPTLEWTGTCLCLLDQTRLPGETAFVDCTDEKMVWDAIKRLVVRGAPAIGVAAAYGAYLSIARCDGPVDLIMHRFREACDFLATSRPTAINLFWALDRVRRAAESGAARASSATIREQILAECHAIRDEDIACCRSIGENALSLFLQLKQKQPIRILTHCNAGALATCGIGTALAPIYLGHERGVKFEVFADETRPLFQGARLTAYELAQAGIPVTVLCDNMAASLMSGGMVDLIIVGADRIAANGDTANKIGTLGLAILARHFGVPFFVAAPLGSIDRKLDDGSQTPIEHRGDDEVARLSGARLAPAEARIHNPAFDVTPARLITAIVTDEGVWRPSAP